MSQPPNFQAPVVEVSTCLLELFGSPVLLLVRLEEQLVVDVELVQKLIHQVQLRRMAMLLQGQESLWAKCQTELSQESSHQCSALCWQPCWLRWQVLHLLSQVPSGQLQLEVSPSSAWSGRCASPPIRSRGRMFLTLYSRSRASRSPSNSKAL